MQTRRIGKTDIEVTELGFGGAPLGAVGSRLTEEEAQTLVQTAYDKGIRYFDTAPLYGHGLSEKRYRSVLPKLPRDTFRLSTKIGRLLVPQAQGTRFAGMRDTEPFSIKYDYSYDGAKRSFEESLVRLGLDRIDILLCHDIDIWTHGEAQAGIFETATDGALRALSDLREEGVIGAFGLGVNEWRVCSEVIDLFKVDCFLLAGRFTLLEQEPLDEFLPKCLEHNVSIIIGGPYNSGVLAVDSRERATYDYKRVSDEIWDKAQAIRNICTDHGVDTRAAALQYPLRHPSVASVIPGAVCLDELNANLDLMTHDVPAALWDDLAAANLTRRIVAT